jgi:hypothetical protein
MKNLFFLPVLAVACSIVSAQDNKTPYLTKSLATDAIKMVEVKTSGGSISVSGVNPSEARVEVYVTPSNNKTLTKAEIEQRIKEKYELVVSVENNKLTARAKSKINISDWSNALSFSFKVFVPSSVSTDLGTSGGSINLNNLSGNLDFSTCGGSLNVEIVSGKVDGKTSGGSIHVANSKNDIELTTSGGSIDAINCDGNLRLSTSGGSLNLHDLKGTIKATTSGGSVKGSDISGELVTSTSGGSIHLSGLSCSLETSTSGGNIDVAITQPVNYIKIGNSSGNIHLELPKSKGFDLDFHADKINTGTLENFSGKSGDEELVGKINGGGIPVTVKAGSGKINIDFK